MQPLQQRVGTEPAAHRAAGHDAAAREVLIQQRRDQLTRDPGITGAERLWIRLTGITLGYGYQPWRALLLLLAVVLTSIALAIGVGGDRGGLASTTTPPATPAPAAAARPPAAAPCSTVEQVGVGLDLGLPLVKTTTRDRCQLTETTAGEVLAVAGWILQALAWAFATLFIAGFTNAVRKT